MPFRLPPEILVQIMLDISRAFSIQDLIRLSLVSVLWSNVARLCRFYYLSDSSPMFPLLQENSRPAISSNGRILSLIECVHHLEISNKYCSQTCSRGEVKTILHRRDDSNTGLTIRLPNLRQLAIRNFWGTIVAVAAPRVYRPFQVVDLSAIYRNIKLRPYGLASFVFHTLAQSQSSLKLFHFEGTINTYEVSSLARCCSLDGLRSLRLGTLRFLYDYQSDLNKYLDVLSKLYNLEHIYLDYHVSCPKKAHKLWQPPHEYIMQAFRGSKVRELSITGPWIKRYLCPKLWRLRREYNAAHPGLSREAKPPPEDLLRIYLCDLTKRYAASMPSLRSLCIAGMNLSIHRSNDGDIHTSIVGDSAKWSFLRGTPREDFLSWRESYRHKRKDRQSGKISMPA